jgi:uncharacterized protein YbjT (DUF2867 family)
MYAIAGVSGNTGSSAADYLLTNEQQVRVIVRDPAKGIPWAKRGAEVAVADLADPAALTEALTGVDGAYLLIPPPPPSFTGLMERARVHTAALKKAVVDSRVGHVVFLSSVGAEIEKSGVVRVLHHAEHELKGLKTPVTFLRAGYFMENWAASLHAVGQMGLLPTFFNPADRPIGMIATRDIGEVAARTLLDPPTPGQVIDLVGPREYSANDVAAALAKILGKTVNVQVAPLEAMVATLKGFGFSEEMAESFRELTEGLNRGAIRVGGGRLVRGTTPLDAVLAGLLKH